MASRPPPGNDLLEARDLDPYEPSAQFCLALEAAPTAMLLSDSDGKVTFANHRAGNLFGYPNGELIGMLVENLMPKRFRANHAVLRDGFREKPRIRTIGHAFELHGQRRDGTELPLEIGLTPLRTATGDFVLSSIVDISDRKQTIDQLQRRTEELFASLKERDLLLQEIHHRVKNNLQVISSLISMQMRKVGPTPARAALDECRTRVEAIGLIHEKLYQSRDYARVPFSDYVRTLTANVLQSVSGTRTGIGIRFDMDEISLAVDQAVPCGLILTELVTNAMKHAWPNGQVGTIDITLARIREQRVRLTVRDDGIGMRQDETHDRPGSMGLQLVRTLCEQLGGKAEIVVSNGTAVSTEFPAETEEA